MYVQYPQDEAGQFWFPQNTGLNVKTITVLKRLIYT